MKVLCMSTVGKADATTASVPFHIAANGCLEVGQETGVILAGNAAELVIGDTLETLEGVGIPPLRELVAKLKEHDVPVYI